MEDPLSETGNRALSAMPVQTQPAVVDLLRQVLECVTQESMPNNLTLDNESGQEILLDVEVDDVRYTLIRSCIQPAPPRVNLSPREQEIVRLVAKGYPNKVIAKVLDISPWTVSTHLRRVFTKLKVGSRAEMVARVLNEGLLSIELTSPIFATNDNLGT